MRVHALTSNPNPDSAGRPDVNQDCVEWKRRELMAETTSSAHAGSIDQGGWNGITLQRETGYLEPPSGIEPETCGLRNRRSTN